jgi:hypothetical protein
MATELFDEVTADPKTYKARLLEVTEKEVKSFEHEGARAHTDDRRARRA